MNTVLLEPTDVLFFRDAVPMSAGQGKGSGCRMPFPSTLHEAFRGSLLRARGELGNAKELPGRPRGAARKGNWHVESHATDVMIASKAFCSLRTAGPFPWQPDKGLLLPVPLDAALSPGGEKLARLQLWRDPAAAPSLANTPGTFRPLCLPLATTPPDKHAQLHGWWTLKQNALYLRRDPGSEDQQFRPLPTDKLWEAEHRVGVEIEPGTFAAKQGQLYAGSYLRAHAQTRFAVQLHLGDQCAAGNGEASELAGLDWLLLGGELRLARIWRTHPAGNPLPDLFAPLAAPPEPPPGDGPCLLKWVLATPAVFTHGSLPGWCGPADGKPDGRPIGEVRLGKSQRKPASEPLPGRALLISWCLARPRTVSGWDVVEQRAKPTLLAVPEGGIYYFLCENRATAAALAKKLHWQPRSDFYGEKGCGYGLVSFDVQMHTTSPDVRALAKELFMH